MLRANTQLIPIIYSRVIAREVSKDKEQMKRVLAGTGVDEGNDKTSSVGMTVNQYRILLENAQRISGDPYIALKAAINLPAGIHGPVGIASTYAPTLQSCLEVIAHFGCLRIPFARIKMIQEGKYTKYIADAGTQLEAQTGPAIDFLFTAIVNSLLLLSEGALRELSLELKRSRPADALIFESLLPCSIRYEQKHDAVVLLTSDLDREIPSANQEVYEDAMKRCHDIYSLQRFSTNEVDTVCNLFIRMSGQVCTIQQITKDMGMSARTLQRRLKQNGTSFQQLLDDWLAKEASKYLLDENLTVEATSVLLGYNDEANFRRAFKRWYGVSTGVYRQQKT